MAGALAGLAAPAGADQPAQGSPTVVDGPSADIARPSDLGVSIARDGSGGLVYLRNVGGTPHVFVSQLSGGTFQRPVQVDTGLGGGSSQPVIAAGNGGLLLVGFINGGALYVVDRTAAGSPFASPIGLAAGASNPSISITNFGKAYLAFTAADRGGTDVRAAYYDNGRWALEAPPLNAAAADSAGTGPGRPEVAAAGDGVAIVVWGEAGHVYARRVWGTSASVVDAQADGPPAGCTEGSADDPVVGAGGDSSFAPVAFHELVTCNGQQQSRVLVNRLHASIFDGVRSSDGLSGAPAEGADYPQIAVTEYGDGWVTSQRTASNAVLAEQLSSNGEPGGAGQVNSLAAGAAPLPVPAAAGLFSTVIAWQQEPGSSGAAEIRVRYAPKTFVLGPEDVVSSPAQGPVDAPDGLAAAGDVLGEAAVAWLQGTPGATTVMVEQLYQPPGSFSATKAPHYARTPQPSFAWTHPRGWGPVKYSLVVDGATQGQTFSNVLRAPAPFGDGPHAWRVVANNPAGQQSQTRQAALFIDTVPPHAKLTLRGARSIRSTLGANLGYADLPPRGRRRSDASGVAKIVIRWGDGTVTRLRPGSHLSGHAYRHPGRYRITLRVTDRAGNVTGVVMRLKILRTAGAGAAKPQTVSSSGASRPKAKAAVR